MPERFEATLVAFLRWAVRTGGPGERDWTSAVLAEAEALPVAQRRGWLLGGAWFVLCRRRPVAGQVLAAGVGVAFALLLAQIAGSSLGDDAPDMPFGAAIALLAGSVILGLTFLVVAVRPLAGALVAVLGLPAYVGLAIAARRLSLASAVSAPPPPGMAAAAEPFGGAVGFAIVLLVLVLVPALALVGALLPAFARAGGDTGNGVRGTGTDGDGATS